jgi:integrase
MQVVETRGSGKDSVKVKELPKDHSQRKSGYRWMVESRLDGKRTRKFFRHPESEQRDIYLNDIRERMESLAKTDRAILSDQKLLEEAARADKALSPHKKSISDAVAFYLDHLQSEAKRDSTPLSEVVKRFLDEKEREGVSESHYDDLRIRISRFERTFGETPIASIGRNQINDWILGLAVGPQTKVNFRRVLSNLFAYASRAGIIQNNPVRDTANVKVRRKKTEILAPEEVANLLTHCTEETLPSVLLMVFCGIRVGEVSRLEWQEIDWEDSTIEITAEKAKREVHARHVNIPSNAVEWLRPLAKRRGLIVPFETRHTFTKALQDVRALAGWQPGEWPKNGLRKTFISCHYESFGSIDETAKQAGTSVGIIHRHYRKLIKEKEAKRLWELHPDQQAEVVSISKGA